jgi:hypothetical protein
MGGDRRRQGVRGVVEGKFEQNRTSGLEIQREDAGDREPFEGLNALWLAGWGSGKGLPCLVLSPRHGNLEVVLVQAAQRWRSRGETGLAKGEWSI